MNFTSIGGKGYLKAHKSGTVMANPTETKGGLRKRENMDLGNET